jgi:hypothetical protein
VRRAGLQRLMRYIPSRTSASAAVRVLVGGSSSQQVERKSAATGAAGAPTSAAKGEFARYDVQRRRLRSGVGVLGSIPGVTVAAGALAVLVLLRFVSLMFPLKDTSESVESESEKETPMKVIRAVAAIFCETAWSFGVSVSAGLLLLP